MFVNVSSEIYFRITEKKEITPFNMGSIINLLVSIFSP